MKKKVLSILLVAAMSASLFAGCGGGSNDGGNAGGNSQADAGNDAGGSDDGGDAGSSDDGGAANTDDAIANLIAATDGTVNIELWCSEMESYQTTMASLVEQFKSTYSDVDFNITIGAVSESDAKDRVLEDPEAAADVFVFADDQINALVTAGALNPVAATYTYDPATANPSSIIDAATVNGQLYAYPLTASNGYFLFYNKNVLSESDIASWEGMLDAASAAGKKVGMDMGNAWYIWGFYAGAGLPTTRDDDDNTSCDWNNELGVAVTESMMNIAGNSAFISTDNTTAVAMASDDLVAFVDGTWDVAGFQDAYGDGYAAAKLPTFNAGGTDYQMGSFAGYKFVGVNAYAENAGWSMLLAEFISNEASQTAIADATGEGPSNINAAASIDSPALAALAAQSAFAYPQSSSVGGKYWDPGASLGSSIVKGEITDVQAKMDEVVAGITQPAQ